MTTPDEKTLATLTKLFEEEFGPIGDRQVLYVHAPGRSEISGNHTDHEGGHVIEDRVGKSHACIGAVGGREAGRHGDTQCFGHGTIVRPGGRRGRCLSRSCGGTPAW